MQKIFSLCLSVIFFLLSCNDTSKNRNKEDKKDISRLFENYFTERMQLLPLEATQNGDTSNNDKLYADFTDSYRSKLSAFFHRYLDQIKKYDRNDLDANDQISYDIFKREMELTIEGLSIGYFGNTVLYPDHKF